MEVNKFQKFIKHFDAQKHFICGKYSIIRHTFINVIVVLKYCIKHILIRPLLNRQKSTLPNLTTVTNK